MGAWTPVAPDLIRRKILTIAIVFVVALVVFVIACAGLVIVLGGPLEWTTIVLFPVEFACLSAAMATILATTSLNQSLRATAGGDLGLMRKFGKIVLQGKSIPLEPEQQSPAARYAAVMAIILRFQLAYFLFFFAFIMLQTVYLLTADVRHSSRSSSSPSLLPISDSSLSSSVAASVPATTPATMQNTSAMTHGKRPPARPNEIGRPQPPGGKAGIETGAIPPAWQRTGLRAGSALRRASPCRGPPGR